MKTWTMPRIDVEAFAANEHVAACTVNPDGGVTISCDYHNYVVQDMPGHDTGFGAFTDCGMEFTIPGNGWVTAKNAAHANQGGYVVDTNGNYYGKQAGSGFRVPSGVTNPGQYALAVMYYSTQKRYVYYIFEYDGEKYFDPHTRVNHYVMGVNNPTS